MPKITYTETRLDQNVIWYAESEGSRLDSDFIDRAELTMNLMNQGVVTFTVSTPDLLTRISTINILDETAFLQAHNVSTLEDLTSTPIPGAAAYNLANNITSVATIE